MHLFSFFLYCFFKDCNVELRTFWYLYYFSLYLLFNFAVTKFSFYLIFYRQKYEAVESEASKGSEMLRESLDSIKHKVHDVIQEASKSEIAKKAGK